MELWRQRQQLQHKRLTQQLQHINYTTQAIEEGALIAAEQLKLRSERKWTVEPEPELELQRQVQARVAEAEAEARDSCQQRCSHHWLKQQHQLKGQHWNWQCGNQQGQRQSQQQGQLQQKQSTQVHELG